MKKKHDRRGVDGDTHRKHPGPDAEVANKMEAGAGSEPADDHIWRLLTAPLCTRTAHHFSGCTDSLGRLTCDCGRAR